MKKSSVILFFVIILLEFFIFPHKIICQQVTINKIQSMPDFPQPYEMRDWKKVTLGYDSLVFNHNLQGQYLPLIFFRNNTINYPGETSFGLHTVVGTTSPNSGEAINVLPAVIGATLVGIDKSSQNGYNWVKMCREYFNNRPKENVYLNHPNTESGEDWWYSVMPNVFFYQLYDLYPETVDFDYQLKSVADQWLKAVEKMGGSSTPWDTPNMDYRGWYLSTMTPHTSGVKEPEAAGAIAWLLYSAYKETNEIMYRIGAEWALEFLNNYYDNPSYELQLPYGVYIAAKMNAELGTEYDVEKMFNWCFDIGPLRSWGVINGRWGGYDLSGLIGEVNGNNDYAFLMNTFEHVGALVPLVRYDDRFANAVGKWVLNAANAARLFYTKYLPDNNQDSEEWAHQYDPHSYMGYEAIRQSKYGQSPYATGDAIDGGWGETNLALYGSSHVGIFGGIIDTTDIEGILKLDLLKTDYFNENVYPTYLFYNPYEESKIININIGNEARDIYETIKNSFLSTNVSGLTQISIPSKSSIVIVLTPSGGEQTLELNKLLINDVVVDYNSGKSIANYPPRIKSLAVKESIVLKEDSIAVFCTAVDKDNDQINYRWQASGGVISGNGEEIGWKAHDQEGSYTIEVEVDDGKGGKDKQQIQIEVVERINTPPVIIDIKADPRKVDLGAETKLTCNAIDNENDVLNFNWYSESGFISGSGSSIKWTSPSEAGNYFIYCSVTDSKGEETIDSIRIAVRDLSIVETGNLLCYYPFNGNANDESGNSNNGTVSGAGLISDRFNSANSAYSFDGNNDFIQIPNNSLLNFQNSITVNFWINIDSFFEREQYPISHGNWERRWKVSITNDKIRWTINTENGIVDLDSETILEKSTWYNITALYSGTDMEIYINGELDAFGNWSGKINQTDLDLTIAQAIPGNNEYNFKGKLDEIRIYDYALHLNEIEKFYDLVTEVNVDNNELLRKFILNQNYPNPFNPSTKILYTIPNVGGAIRRDGASSTKVLLKIYDILGNEITTLVNELKPAGTYEVEFNTKNLGNNEQTLSSGVYFYTIRAGDNLITKKMVFLK